MYTSISLFCLVTNGALFMYNLSNSFILIFSVLILGIFFPYFLYHKIITNNLGKSFILFLDLFIYFNKVFLLKFILHIVYMDFIISIIKYPKTLENSIKFRLFIYFIFCVFSILGFYGHYLNLILFIFMLISFYTSEYKFQYFINLVLIFSF